MEGDVVWNLQAIPLTPIHVGDGTSYEPDSYDLRDGHLCRFDPHRVMRAMGGEQRRLFTQALDAGRLPEAQAILRENADDAHILARILAGSQSATELRRAMQNERGYGLVSPFVRSAAAPYIPGSTIKGAFRTAWLSARAGQVDARALEAAMADGPPKFKAERAEHFLVDRPRNRVEQDPFRFFSVADATLANLETRIDRIVNWRPKTRQSEGAEKIQLHVERLLSSADGVIRASRFAAVIGSASRQARQRALDDRRAPRLDLTADEIWKASRAFHWQLFDRERERFWNDYPEVRDRLNDVFRFPFGGKDRDEASWRAIPNVALVRIGRFGHFESKSLEGYRSQVRPQDKSRRPVSEGATRMLVECTRNNRDARVPLGWMLLMRLKASP